MTGAAVLLDGEGERGEGDADRDVEHDVEVEYDGVGDSKRERFDERFCSDSSARFLLKRLLMRKSVGFV